MSEFITALTKKPIKNQEDEKGRSHGRWASYWGNEKIWSKGVFRNGIKHGMWERYNDEGKLIWKGEFKSDRDIGLWYEERFN
jgi:antitoxin component YwqK of YwqJK toxin-antitoxin module